MTTSTAPALSTVRSPTGVHQTRTDLLLGHPAVVSDETESDAS